MSMKPLNTYLGPKQVQWSSHIYGKSYAVLGVLCHVQTYEGVVCFEISRYRLVPAMEGLPLGPASAEVRRYA